MFKKLTFAATAAAAFAVASPASAALTLIANPATCTTSDAVCNWNVVGFTDAGAFSQSATFELPQLGNTGSSITNSATKLAMGSSGNIDFTSIFLTDPNGMVYNYSLTPTGLVETGNILLATVAGTYKLTVEGTANTAATYGGNITFSAVPEPATWALMILGFGAVGFSMRRRSAKAGTTRATLKFA